MVRSKMENEEPNLVVPRPFPLDPTEAMNESGSLDLTPEKPHTKRNGIWKRKVRLNADQPEGIKCSSSCKPTSLYTPHLNSTAHVIRRLKAKKEEFLNNPASASPGPFPVSQEEIHRLEEAVQQEPLKELNVPYDATRYKDLVSVHVSDDSFQKLVFVPRKKRRPAGSSHSREEPDVMDIMVAGLECEEANWIEATPVRTELCLQSMVMDSDDVFALNSFTKSLQ